MESSYPIFMAVFFILSISHSATAACKSNALSNGKTFENCDDLPALDATLHWTFDAGKSTLSMAFTAAPPAGDGWVAWGLNPEMSGMVGTQALVAGKFDGGSSVTADTVDIQSYHALIKGPISYNVTGISAESADGKITIFGEWVIPAGASTVNQVWQVGPIVGGKPGKHATETPNLTSRMKLSLAGSPAGAPESASVSVDSHVPAPETAMEPVRTTPVKESPVTGSGEALFFSSSLGLGLVALVMYFIF